MSELENSCNPRTNPQLWQNYVTSLTLSGRAAVWEVGPWGRNWRQYQIKSKYNSVSINFGSKHIFVPCSEAVTLTDMQRHSSKLSPPGKNVRIIFETSTISSILTPPISEVTL